MHKLRQFIDCKGNVRASDGKVLQDTNNVVKQCIIRKLFSFISRETGGRGHWGVDRFGFNHFGTAQYIFNVALL